MKKTLLLLLASKLLFAINLAPMTETLDSKSKKNIVFKVSNPSKEPVAVQFAVLKVLDTNGIEKRVETQTVEAYPTQFVLAPKESKSVRVRYMGASLPKQEEVYRIIAKELDIDVNDKKVEDTQGKVKAQIKMRFSYEGLLFVHQADAQAQLKVENFQQTPKGVTLSVSNIGTSSALPNLSNYNYFANVKGKEYLLTKKDLKDVEFKRVLAGKVNTFNLTHITTIPLKKIESLRLEKK